MSTILCRFFHTREETIQHLLAGCEALTHTKYLYRHNMVAKVVHWHLCKTFHVQLDVTSWHDHQPLPVVENNEIKLLWDFGMVTDHMISHNRPDITVFLRRDHHILFAETACPADVNVLAKEDEKILKYQGLAREVSTGYNQPVDIIPVVFGHSGVVSCRQGAHLKRLPLFTDRLFGYLQQAVTLGTVSILRSMEHWLYLGISSLASVFLYSHHVHMCIH